MTKRKTTFRWYYTRKGKKHLTKKAKEYLSKRLKEAIRRKKIRKFLVNVIHFKAIYKSSRSSSHDFILEGEYVTDREYTEEELKTFILDNLSSGDFETNTALKDFFDMIPFNKIEIGISKERREEEADNILKVFRYGYRIET